MSYLDQTSQFFVRQQHGKQNLPESFGQGTAKKRQIEDPRDRQKLVGRGVDRRYAPAAMKSQVVIEQVQFFSDPRGWVLEPIPEGILGVQRNAHVAFTEPGCVRGNHYHERSTEIFVVTGPSLVRIREGGALRDVCVPKGQAFRFTIPKGISHAVQNQGTTPMLLMAFNTLPHDRDHPDAVRDMLIEK